MKRKLTAVLAPAAVLALVVGGAQIAQADSAADTSVLAAGSEAPDDDAGEVDEQVTGPARDDAEAAALQAVDGGGTVTEVEVADEGDSGYEVEVEKDDGSYVEVALDTEFGVVSVEEDDD